MNAVPRSKLSVAIATRQPSLISPTTLAQRDAHVVVEDLAEVAVAGERLDRPDRRCPGASIGQMTQVMPLCFGAVRVGAHQQLLVLGDLPEAGPDLLAGDDEVVAVDHGARLQRRRGRSRRWARRSPGTRPRRRRRIFGRWNAFCSSVPQAISVGPAWFRPTNPVLTSGAPARAYSSYQISCSIRRGAAAAVLLRPVDARPAGVEHACAATPCRSRGDRAGRRSPGAARVGTFASSQPGPGRGTPPRRR